MNNLLQINKLSISIADKQILDNFNLSIKKGQTHVLMGPNGSGKSTLVQFLAGNPKIRRVSGEVIFRGKNFLRLKSDQRSKQGIFISFQKAIEIPGVSTATVLRSSLNTIRQYRKQSIADVATFYKMIKPIFELVGFDLKFLSRDFNCGFSGGESKKLEFIQYLLLEPPLAIFDEVDSGLDVKSIKIITNYIRNKKPKDQSIIIVTHNPLLVKSLKPDYVYEFK